MTTKETINTNMKTTRNELIICSYKSQFPFD
jgi:hypothetical protein